MPSIEIHSPVSSAPSDRLALGVGWVRPGAGAIDGGLNPSLVCLLPLCFEGNDE